MSISSGPLNKHSEIMDMLEQVWGNCYVYQQIAHSQMILLRRE